MCIVYLQHRNVDVQFEAVRKSINKANMHFNVFSTYRNHPVRFRLNGYYEGVVHIISRHADTMGTD